MGAIIYKIINMMMLLCVGAGVFSVSDAAETKVNCITKGYASQIEYVKKSVRSGLLFFDMKNGVIIPWDEGDPSLADTLKYLYPRFRTVGSASSDNQDPGRLIDQTLMQSVYGANQSDVKSSLVRVRWMPLSMHAKPIYLSFNYHNGAAKALTQVSRDLDSLPESLKKYVDADITTFKWARDPDSNKLLSNAYGIAININPKYRDYWRTAKKDKNGKPIYHNQIPEKIVKIFEEDGFIWGGRWHHFDTTHFEYRPEFSYPACIQQGQ